MLTQVLQLRACVRQLFKVSEAITDTDLPVAMAIYHQKQYQQFLNISPEDFFGKCVHNPKLSIGALLGFFVGVGLEEKENVRNYINIHICAVLRLVREENTLLTFNQQLKSLSSQPDFCSVYIQSALDQLYLQKGKRVGEFLEYLRQIDKVDREYVVYIKDWVTEHLIADEIQKGTKIVLEFLQEIRGSSRQAQILFEGACNYFDSKGVYESLLDDGFFGNDLKYINILLGMDDMQLIPNTIRYMKNVLNQLRSQSISLNIARSIDTLQPAKRQGFVQLMEKAGNENAATIDQYLNAINENYTVYEQRKKVYQSFILRTRILSREDQEELQREIDRVFKVKYNSVTLQKVHEDFSPLLSQLEKSLTLYYQRRELACFQDYLISKLTTATIPLAQLGSHIISSAEAIIVEINSILHNIYVEPVRRLVEVFGKTRNVETEVGLLKTILNADIGKERWDFLSRVLTNYLSLEVERNRIALILETRDIINLRCDTVYDSLVLTQQQLSPERFATLHASDFTRVIDSAHQIFNTQLLIHGTALMSFLELLHKSLAFVHELEGYSSAVFGRVKDIITDYDKPTLTSECVDVLQDLKMLLESLRNETRTANIITACTEFYGEHQPILHDMLSPESMIREEFKKLKDTPANPKIAHLGKVQLILGSSTLTFILKDKEWDIECNYAEGIGVVGHMEKQVLFELGEKVYLFKNLHSRQAEKMAEVQMFGRFFDLTTKLHAIESCLRELTELVYPLLNRDYNVICQDGNYDSCKILHNNLEELRKHWERTLCQAYRDFPTLSFFLPCQFAILRKYFDSGDCQDEAQKLLRFAGLPCERPANRPKLSTLPRPRPTPEEEIQELGRMLEALAPRPESYLKEETVQSFTLRPRFNERTHEIVEHSPLMRALFQRHMGVPHYRQTLYCHEDTQWQELLCFAYRTLWNPIYLYTLIFPERLSYKNQQRLQALLSEKENAEKLATIPLAIITQASNCPILQFFGDLRRSRKKDLNHSALESIQTAVASFLGKTVYEATQIIGSRHAGLGKTSLITSDAQEAKAKLLWLSLAGDVTEQSFAENLQKLAKRVSEHQGRCVVAFKLHQVLNSELLNILILQLLLYRQLIYRNQLIAFPENCTLKLEIEGTASIPIECKRYFSWGEYGCEYLTRLDYSRKILNRTTYFLSLLDNKEFGSMQAINFAALPRVPDPSRNFLIKKYFMRLPRPQDIDLQPNRTLLQLNMFTRYLSKGIKLLMKVQFGRPPRGLYPRELMFRILLKEAQDMTDTNIETLTIIANDKLSPEDRQSSMVRTLAHDYGAMQSKSLLVFSAANSSPRLICAQNSRPHEANSLRLCPGFEELGGQSSEDRKHDFFYEQLRWLFPGIESNSHEYMLTFDNFFKILYLYNRVRAGIPVVLIGETGCGKTATVRFMCERLHLGIFRVLSMHAGIKLSAIEQFVRDVAKEALDVHKEEQKRKEEGAGAVTHKKFWVFFDEVNASENIGLVTEVMCDHTLHGEVLPSNMRFLAACNPYKLRAIPNFWDYTMDYHKKAAPSKPVNQLVYRVYPLPDTLTHYAWGFGTIDSLHNATPLKMYITAMIHDLDYGPTHPEERRNKIVELLVSSHNFFKEREEKHLVSLRDINRYIIFYEEFLQLCNGVDKYIDAAILAMHFCYYYRLSDRTIRALYRGKLSFERFGRYTNDEINALMDRVMNQVLEPMKLPPGVVWTQSLREITFVMIMCIRKRIPLLVVGKPGCSKSLGLKVIADNYHGRHSTSPHFRNYPEIVLFKFQGSVHCTSEGIECVFDRAFKNAQANHDCIPVVVIEEIGLCEVAPRNPLKVLHGKLDLQRDQQRDNAPTVAFVGLSNWRLDAAKMNRALCLARVPPGREELLDTASKFAALPTNPALDETDKAHLQWIAEAYYEVYKNLDSPAPPSGPEFERPARSRRVADVFGLRDFYSVLKEVSERIANVGPGEKPGLVRAAIQKNFAPFGDLQTDSKILQEYSRRVNAPIDFGISEPCGEIRRIKQSLRGEGQQRYVMVVGPYHTLKYVQDYYLQEEVKHMKQIVGSEFDLDHRSDDYKFRVLSEIIFCLKEGTPVVLVNLADIYTCLYDLFNQYCGEAHVRIPIGARYNPLCKVSPRFHCLVHIDPDDFDRENPPLLNRFEKHRILLKDLLSGPQREAFTVLNNWAESLCKYHMINVKVGLTPRDLFANYSEDLLIMLVLLQNAATQTPAAIVQACKKKLIDLAAIELTLVARVYTNKEEAAFIQRSYTESRTTSLKDEIASKASLEGQAKDERMLYFTYADPRSDLADIFANVGALKILRISTLNREDSLKTEIYDFFTNPKSYRLLLVAVNYRTESKHILSIGSIIDTMANEYDPAGTKKVCVLVFLRRRSEKRHTSSIYLHGYDMRMYDGFELKVKLLSPLPQDPNELPVTFRELVRAEVNKQVEQDFKEILRKAVSLVQRNMPSTDQALANNSLLILETGNVWKQLQRPFLDRIYEGFALTNGDDDIFNILCSREGLRYQDLESAFCNTIADRVENFVGLIIYNIEKCSALASFFLEDEDTTKRRALWFAPFRSLPIDWEIKINEPMAGGVLVNNYIKDLVFPFSKFAYDTMTQERHTKGNNIALERFDEVISEVLPPGKWTTRLATQLLDDILLISLIANKRLQDKASFVGLLRRMLLNADQVLLKDHLTVAINIIVRRPELISNVAFILHNYESLTATKVTLADISTEPKSPKPDDVLYIKHIHNLLNWMIPRMEPNETVINQIDKMPRIYIRRLKHIESLMLAIKVPSETDIPNWPLLRFWIDFTQLLAQRPGTIARALRESIEQLREIESRVPGRSTLAALRSRQFRDHVERITGALHEYSGAFAKFNGTFYKLRFESSEQLPEVVALFRAKTDCRAWYNSLLRAVASNCGLTPLPLLNFQPTPYLHTLDEVLSEPANEPFIVSLFYFLLPQAQIPSTQIRQAPLPGEYAAEIDNLCEDEQRLPHVRRLLALLRLRGYLEQYAQGMYRQEAGDIRTSLQDILNRITPLATTLRLFVVKMTPNEQCDKVKRELEHRLNLKVLEAQPSVDVPEPIVFAEKKAFEYERTATQLLRYMKLVNITNDNALPQYIYNYINEILSHRHDRNSTCYLQLVAFVTAIINEFYFLYLSKASDSLRILEESIIGWRDTPNALVTSLGKWDSEATLASIYEFVIRAMLNFRFGASGGLFQIGPQLTEGVDRLMAVFACFSVGIVVCAKQKNNPFVSLFFADGKLHLPLIENMRNCYVVGNWRWASNSDVQGYRPPEEEEIVFVGERCVAQFTSAFFGFVFHSLLVYFADSLQAIDLQMDSKNIASICFGLMKQHILDKWGNTNNTVVYRLLCFAFTSFAEMMNVATGDPHKQNEVQAFWNTFEAVAHTVLIPNPALIDRYANNCRTFKNSPGVVTSQDLLTESHRIPYLHLADYFQKPETASFEDMMQNLQEPQQKQLYVLSPLLLKVDETEWIELKLLGPLIKLVNRVTDTYNYRLTRTEAKTRQLTFQEAVRPAHPASARALPQQELEELKGCAPRATPRKLNQGTSQKETLEVLYNKCKDVLEKILGEILPNPEPRRSERRDAPARASQSRVIEGRRNESQGNAVQGSEASIRLEGGSGSEDLMNLRRLFQASPLAIHDYIIQEGEDQNAIKLALQHLAKIHNKILNAFYEICGNTREFFPDDSGKLALLSLCDDNIISLVPLLFCLTFYYSYMPVLETRLAVLSLSV